MRSMWKKYGLGGLVVASGMLISLTLATDVTEAKVTGVCSNCHTMHNSQNGTSMAVGGTGVGWNSSGKLDGSLSAIPQGRLLIASCVGCHSSTTGETIISLGGSKIPIVYNTVAYPSQPLAGGNFYWTAQSGEDPNHYKYESYGHNVYGIAGVDSKLPVAPGSEVTCGTTSCHETLAAAGNIVNKPGCEGCHTEVFHHTDNACYRFLSGKGVHTFGLGTPWVEGVEDPNWEQTPATGHNTYKGKAGPVTTEFLGDTHSMSGYCGGCHKKFHWYNSAGADKGTGASSPWLRHPSDILLPQGTEYAAYDPLQPGKYRNDAPVAYTDPLSPSRATAVVMCLSCHRPHGSDQPDLLRWAYSGMNAHQGSSNPASGTGCFVCHTTKDDV